VLVHDLRLKHVRLFVCPRAAQMKPLRAFPLPIHVGTDICQISRIHAILSGPQRLRFVNRILTTDEPSRRDSRLEAALRLDDAAPAEFPPRKGEAERDKDGVLGDRETLLWKAATFMAGRWVFSWMIGARRARLTLDVCG
jgi:hypothetical protein